MARVFRYLYRVPLLLVHLLVFLPVTLLCLSPLLVSQTITKIGRRSDLHVVD